MVSGDIGVWRCLSRTGVAGVLAVAVCALGVDRAGADGHNRIVATDIFGPQAGWALETDDAFVLTNAGCLEALTRRDADGALRPALAESWTRHSPTEWDFAIRPGVVFQDGTPLTAAVVSDALNALLAATAPPRAFSPKRVASVEAVGPMTVRIATPAPSVLLPARVAAPNTGILSPAAFAGATVDPVGHCTGPFEIVEYLPLQAVRLKRNDNYWGGPVSLEAGELRFIPEGSCGPGKRRSRCACRSRRSSACNRSRTSRSARWPRPAPPGFTSTMRRRRSTMRTCAARFSTRSTRPP